MFGFGAEAVQADDVRTNLFTDREVWALSKAVITVLTLSSMAGTGSVAIISKEDVVCKTPETSFTARSKQPGTDMSGTCTSSNLPSPWLFEKKSSIQEHLLRSRTVPRTLYPAERNWSTTCDPMRPFTPVMRTVEPVGIAGFLIRMGEDILRKLRAKKKGREVGKEEKAAGNMS
jgi:hypothetical protein